LSEAPTTGSNRAAERVRQALLRPRSRRVAVGIWVIAALAFAAACFPLFASLAQLGTTSSDEVTEDFNAGHIARPDRLLVVDGFSAGDRGWYLDPGASGRLEYQIPGRSGSTIELNLWVDAGDGVTDTIIVRAAGQPDAVLSTNATLAGDKVDLPPRFATAPSVVIEIQAHNASGSQALVIDQLVSYDQQGTEPIAPPIFTYLTLGGLVSLVTIALIRRRPNALPVALAMGVVVAIATYARITALMAVRLPLAPDAIGYRAYADSFQWWPLFDHGIFSGNFKEREPFFPMVVHAYFQVLGSSDFHLLVVSATLSVAVVVLSVVAARRRLKFWPAALGVGLLLAVSVPLIQESVRGLRLELEMVVLLLLYIALDRGPARRPVLDAVIVGALGAAMVLTRTEFIPVFGAAVAISFLARYRPLPRAVGLVTLAVIIMAGAAAAHRIGLYEHQQDAFFDTAGYTRWLANVEHFAYHRPLSHPELFPTFADYQKFGPFAGPKISTTQYFFVIHSPQEFVRDSLAGARKIFETIDGFLGSSRLGLLAHLGHRIDLTVRWLVLFGLLGMLFRAWRHPRLALIPVLVLSWLGLNAFLVDHGLLERYRHTWQTIPLALIAAAWLVESVVLIAIRRFQLKRDYARWYRLAKLNVDLALFPIAVGLALVQAALSPRVLLVDAILVAIAIGLLAYRRPAVGTVALALVVSVSSPQSAATAAAVALIAVLARERPAVQSLLPILIVAPLGLAISIAAGRLSSAALLLAATMVCVVATVAVVAREPARRVQVIWWLAAIGPIAGIAFLLEPAPAPAAALAPVGVLAAGWLYLRGERLALPLGLVNLAIVILVEPFFAWLGVVVALGWLLMASERFRGARPRLAAAAAATAVLGLLAGGASLAATSPTADVGWSSRLASTDSSITQQITVDRAGDNNIWIYASRASAFTDYPVRVVVNGAAVTDNLNSYLTTGQLTWVNVPLQAAPGQGDRVDVRLIATGNPNAVDRYIDVGGVYSRVAGLSSPGTQAGTYLIVLGDDSLPLAPGGLPEPMVRGRWQLPTGEGLPGELGAPVTAREQVGTWQIWGAALQITARNPLGLGLSGLSTALNQIDGSIAPGLSARDEYLQAATEWGLAGLASLLILLGVAAWFARRSGDNLAVALLLLTVVSMAGESLLLDPAGAAATWVVVGLCLTAGAASRSTSRT
jgi:hypothetical protein